MPSVELSLNNYRVRLSDYCVFVDTYMHYEYESCELYIDIYLDAIDGRWCQIGYKGDDDNLVYIGSISLEYPLWMPEHTHSDEELF